MNFIDTIKSKDGKSLRMITRPSDYYVNATEMCKSAGKEWSNYFKSAATKEFLAALKTSLPNGRNPIDSITKGINENRGTWVDSQVAIDLAAWISPQFKVEVTKTIQRYINGEITAEESVQVSQAVIQQQRTFAGFLTSAAPCIVHKIEGWFYVRVVNPFFWDDIIMSDNASKIIMTRYIIKFGIAENMGKRNINETYKDDHGYFLYAIHVTDKQHAAHIESILRSEFKNMTVGSHKEYVHVDKLMKYYGMLDDEITQENYKFLASVLFCDALNRLKKFYPEYEKQFGEEFELKDNQGRLTHFFMDARNKGKGKVVDLDTLTTARKKIECDELIDSFKALQINSPLAINIEKPKPLMYDVGTQASPELIEQAFKEKELEEHRLLYGGFYGQQEPIKSRAGLRIQQIDPNDHQRIIKIFDGISQAAVDIGVKRAQISDAIRDNRILLGFRWRRVLKDEDEKVVPTDFPPNATEMKKTGQPIAKLDHKGEKILHVYDTQREAAEDHDIEWSAICNAMRRQKKSAGFFWKWWDECDEKMRKAYEDEHGIYKRKGPRRDTECHQIDPNTGKVIRVFECIADAAETLRMSPDRISKATKDGSTFRSWKWKVVKRPKRNVIPAEETDNSDDEVQAGPSNA